MGDLSMIAGQLMGGVAVCLGFVSFQMRTRKQLLVVQLATAVAFCIHYGLIGAVSGMVMNILCVIRNFVYYHKDKSKFLSGPASAIIFAIIYSVAGLLSWQGYYSVFMVLGQVISTVCMSFTNPQNIRKSILVTSPLVLIYNAFVFSLGGVVYESVVIISSIIGIIRYRQQKQTADA